MGVAGANMLWGHFFAPVAVKRERTLHLNESYKVLGDFRVPVSKFIEVVIHVEKLAKFGGEKAKIYAAEMPVLEMGRILKAF